MMSDVFSRSKRSNIMSRIKGADTKPEKAVRSLLHRLGYRFRIHRSELPGKPDIVLPKHSKIIMVNGCFWHGHKYCSKGRTRPASNKRFWNTKIERTIKRDKSNIAKLRRLGWGVLIVWECQTKDESRLERKLLKFMRN
jgi:DNA mismatch endonuclease (patch repair protein)